MIKEAYSYLHRELYMGFYKKKFKKTRLYKLLLELHISILKLRHIIRYIYLKILHKMMIFYEVRVPFEIKKRIEKLSYLLDTEDMALFEDYKEKLYVEEESVKYEEIDEAVSVVIPTKNAGSDFYILIKKILLQKYVHIKEIIIVDSGSTDDTLSIAKDNGVKIIKIPEKEFSHAKARNIGLKSTKTKYSIVMVQDAIPLNQVTFHDLLAFSIDKGASATSCKQFIRSDADIFVAWQMLEYENMITKNGRYFKSNIVKEIDASKFEKLPMDQKRFYCSLDDVCTIFDMEQFNKIKGYNEEYSYGEDLEIGKRFIANGHKLGFLNTNGVIHSHNRGSDYILKRFFTDTVFLFKVFGSLPNKTTEDSLKTDVLLISIKKFLESNYNNKCLGILSRIMKNKSIIKEITADYEIRHAYEKMFHNIGIKKDSNMNNKDYQHFEEELLKKTEFFLKHVHRSILSSYFNGSEIDQSELIVLIDKLTALIISNMLAGHYLHNENEGSGLIRKINNYMTKGI